MNQSLRSRSNYSSKALLLLIGFLVAASAHSQTIQVQDYQGNPVASGGAVYIDPNVGQWPMPTVTITVNGTCTQQSVAEDLSLSYTDPYSNSSSYGHISWDTGTHNTQTGTPWTINWGSYGFTNLLSEGGSGTVTAHLGNGTVLTFKFSILGHNVPEYPQPNLVDQYYTSSGVNAPWFWGSLLALESSGRQYDSSGNPLTTPTPDGIGIAQLDGQQNPSYAQDCVYWNYRCNIDLNLDILNGNQSGAYTFWSNQVTQSNSTPVPSGDNTSCDGSYFSYPQTGSWNFEDAEWIQSYNGTWPNGYFIAWNEMSYPNQWHINYPYTRNGVTYDYVHQVCNASPY